MWRSLFICFTLMVAGCALPVKQNSGQKFIDEHDLDAVSLARQGGEFFRTGRMVDAELYLRQSLYINPGAPNIRANLASVLVALKEYDEAFQILQNLMQEYPESNEFEDQLARSYIEIGDYDAAAVHLRRVFERALNKRDFPLAAREARSQAALAFRVGHEESALCESSQALFLKRDADEVSRHAKLLLALNRPSDAAATASAYMNEQGSARDPRVFLQLALAQYALGKKAEVRETQRVAADLASDDDSTHREIVLLGDILDREDAAEAEEVPEKVAKLALALVELSPDARIFWPREYSASVQKLLAAVKE